MGAITMDKPDTEKTVQKEDLLNFYDEFVEFNDYCAFLCDAMSALFSEYADGEVNSYTIQGVRRQCGDLKERSERLEEVLAALYKQSYTDSQVTRLKYPKKENQRS